MIIELVISLKTIKFMIIWQWRTKLQHRMIPNEANNIYETNENSYFSKRNCCIISYLLLVATHFCRLCLSYRQTSLKRNIFLKTLLKHSEFVQAWWHQIDKNFIHEGLYLTGSVYLSLGWPAMPPHLAKRILLCLHTVACTIPILLHKGGSRRLGGHPPKPTKVTFFNMILYNSENRIHDIRPFCRLLFRHSSALKYTSSLLQ